MRPPSMDSQFTRTVATRHFCKLNTRLLDLNVKGRRARYRDLSIRATPGWLSDWDSSAAVEGGLILTIGSSLFYLARSKLTGQYLPQKLPPQPGKWAAITVVGALPTLQWMAWLTLLAASPALWTRKDIVKYCVISALYAGAIWFGSTDVLALLLLGMLCILHLQVEQILLRGPPSDASMGSSSDSEV
eukprot:jgi/Botrbrau1/16536/Bobra.0327s0005.2